MQIFTTWTNLKQLISDKSLDVYYKEESRRYTVYTLHEQNQIGVEIWKDGSCVGINMTTNDEWKSDFETNFKASAREL